MSSDRDQQISEIFLKAIEMPDPERDAWLKRVCADDDVILGEVQSLLAHHSTKELIKETGSLREQTTLCEDATEVSSLQPVYVSREKHPSDWGRFFAILAGIIVGITILTLMAAISIRRELHRNVNAQLKSAIQSDVATIEYWMQNQMRLAENWAAHPDVQDSLTQQAAF